MFFSQSYKFIYFPSYFLHAAKEICVFERTHISKKHHCFCLFNMYLHKSTFVFKADSLTLHPFMCI